MAITSQHTGSQQLTTAERPVSKTREQVIKEAKRIEESLLYSSKGHFAAASFWSNFHLFIGVPMVVMSTIAGASALSKLDPSFVVAGVLSIFVAALSGVVTFLNPNEKVSAHRNAGNCFDALLNKVRIFRAIECWGDETDEVLAERLKHHSGQKDHLNQTSPQIPGWAYRAGKKGIESGEAEFAVDKANEPVAIGTRQP